MVKINVYMKLS